MGVGEVRGPGGQARRGDVGVSRLSRIIGHECVRMRKRMRSRAAAGPAASPARLPTAPSRGSGEPRQVFKQVSVAMKMTVTVIVLTVACSSGFLELLSQGAVLHQVGRVSQMLSNESPALPCRGRLRGAHISFFKGGRQVTRSPQVAS